MSMLVDNEVGWIVDHQLHINNTYTTTYIFENCRLSDYFTNRTGFSSGKLAGCSVCQFKVVPELFAIRQAFMMDSQFSKCAKTNQMSDSSGVAVKKCDMPHCDHEHEPADRCVIPPALQLSLMSKVNNETLMIKEACF